MDTHANSHKICCVYPTVIKSVTDNEKDIPFIKGSLSEDFLSPKENLRAQEHVVPTFLNSRISKSTKYKIF